MRASGTRIHIFFIYFHTIKPSLKSLKMLEDLKLYCKKRLLTKVLITSQFRKSNIKLRYFILFKISSYMIVFTCGNNSGHSFILKHMASILFRYNYLLRLIISSSIVSVVVMAFEFAWKPRWVKIISTNC